MNILGRASVQTSKFPGLKLRLTKNQPTKKTTKNIRKTMEETSCSILQINEVLDKRKTLKCHSSQTNRGSGCTLMNQKWQRSGK